MHAFYCRLLHLHHAHDADAADPDTQPQATSPLAKPAALNRLTPLSTPSPRLRQRAGTDRDHRPSLHTLVVPRLIDSGYTLDQISDLTGMPRALVDLIADEHGPADVTADAAASALREVLQAKRREAKLTRQRRIRTAAVIVLAAVVNIVASVASVVWRIPPLGAVATLGSFLLIPAVSFLARRGTRSTPGTSDAPR